MAPNPSPIAPLHLTVGGQQRRVWARAWREPAACLDLGARHGRAAGRAGEGWGGGGRRGGNNAPAPRSCRRTMPASLAHLRLPPALQQRAPAHPATVALRCYPGRPLPSRVPGRCSLNATRDAEGAASREVCCGRLPLAPAQGVCALASPHAPRACPSQGRPWSDLKKKVRPVTWFVDFCFNR